MKRQYSLLENSHSFLREAANRGVSALEDPAHWPFAILSLVQAVELSLKEILRQKHPILIFQNIDAPEKTVSIEKAMLRLANPKIGGIKFPESEKSKLRAAIKWRNFWLRRRGVFRLPRML
jgi:hypothetical protein